MRRCIRWALLAAAAMPAVAAQAQAPAQAPVPITPPSNGGIYNGTQHEPNPSATKQQEQSAGVGLAPQQQQQLNSTVEQLDKQVLQDAATPTGAAAGCTANQQKCPP